MTRIIVDETGAAFFEEQEERKEREGARKVWEGGTWRTAKVPNREWVEYELLRVKAGLERAEQKRKEWNINHSWEEWVDESLWEKWLQRKKRKLEKMRWTAEAWEVWEAAKRGSQARAAQARAAQARAKRWEAWEAAKRGSQARAAQARAKRREAWEAASPGHTFFGWFFLLAWLVFISTR